MVVDHDVNSLPPRYDLAEAQRDLAVLDLLRPPPAALDEPGRRHGNGAGQRLLSAALEGCAIAKAFGKGAGLDALKEAMATRFSGKRRAAKPGAQ
jgi:hypothetical protein